MYTNEHENFIQDKHGYCFYNTKDDAKIRIYNLYIKPEYRRLGYAKKHLLYVINEIKLAGITSKITIEAVPEENSISLNDLISFYESLGLEVINRKGC